MKEEVVDTLVFQGPDGGKITMSMQNYPDKEIERLKARLMENGWLFIAEEKDFVEVEEENVPFFSKFRMFLFGGLAVSLIQILATAWVEAGG